MAMQRERQSEYSKETVMVHWYECQRAFASLTSIVKNIIAQADVSSSNASTIPAAVTTPCNTTTGVQATVERASAADKDR